jgi:hypothetical protein
MARERPGMTVRFVEEYKNSFTGLTWRVYEDRSGRRVSVCVRSYFDRRPKTRAQCRAEAGRRLQRTGR